MRSDVGLVDVNRRLIQFRRDAARQLGTASRRAVRETFTCGGSCWPAAGLDLATGRTAHFSAGPDTPDVDEDCRRFRGGRCNRGSSGGKTRLNTAPIVK